MLYHTATGTGSFILIIIIFFYTVYVWKAFCCSMKKPHPVFPLDAVLCCVLAWATSVASASVHLMLLPDIWLNLVLVLPLYRYFLTSFYTKYDRVHFIINTISLLTVLIPKLPQFHGVRLFGINKYWRGFDLQHKRMCGYLLCGNKKVGNLELQWMLCCFAVKVAEQSAMVSLLLKFFYITFSRYECICRTTSRMQ